MFKVIADYGLTAKCVIFCVVSLGLIIAAIILDLVTMPHALILLSVWGITAFLVLPTRYLIAERLGCVRRLPIADRRAANLIIANQKQLFTQAGLVGVQVKHRKTRDNQGRTITHPIEVNHYPKLSRPIVAPYGFRFDLELPGQYGITATKTAKANELIDGYISYLLRRVSPAVTTEIEVVSGSAVRLMIRCRDEWGQIVTLSEVE